MYITTYGIFIVCERKSPVTQLPSTQYPVPSIHPSMNTILEDARRRLREVKRMMKDLDLDVKHLNERDVWNMKTYTFCRALKDASFVIEKTLDVFTEMHHHIDQTFNPDQVKLQQMHPSIQRVALEIAGYGDTIAKWQKMYQCSS